MILGSHSLDRGIMQTSVAIIIYSNCPNTESITTVVIFYGSDCKHRFLNLMKNVHYQDIFTEKNEPCTSDVSRG